MLPFPSMMIPLSCFFATERVEGDRYTDGQREQLVRWFWRTALSRRYSADVNAKQAFDINELTNLKKSESYGAKLPAIDLKIEFDKANFLNSSANSKTLICMLAQKSPHSLISGASIDLDKVLKRGSKHEFHHIYPQKVLKDIGLERRDINVLANICFLTRSDNNFIRAKEPSVYDAHIPAVRRAQYLEESLIPEDFSDDNYAKFIAGRSELLKNTALQLMG